MKLVRMNYRAVPYTHTDKLDESMTTKDGRFG